MNGEMSWDLSEGITERAEALFGETISFIKLSSLGISWWLWGSSLIGRSRPRDSSASMMGRL
jgi:hypothetical protein